MGHSVLFLESERKVRIGTGRGRPGVVIQSRHPKPVELKTDGTRGVRCLYPEADVVEVTA